MVYYRKYRPQTIDELDNKNVRDTLFDILKNDNYPHAFLFTGPKGLGKTSTARIVAKYINCEAKKGEKPCNKCDSCISITNGMNMDVLEIDAASNRGIDEIRDLREKIKLSPFSARKKVYIIDEVHMLTTESFNALLKTLEEPPAHAVFILCTTEPHKVPDTIASRCFHINFTRATTEELVRSFERIAKGEKIAVDHDALVEIARLSDGSFRDGTKVLEEIVTRSKREKITAKIVEEKFQISNFKYQISTMIAFLEKRDAKKSLRLISELMEQGVNMKYFIEQLIGVLHAQILENIGIKESAELTIKSSELTIEEMKSLIQLLTKAHGELKFSVLPQLPLELAVIEWVGLISQSTEAVHAGDSKPFSVQKPKTTYDEYMKQKGKKNQAEPIVQANNRQTDIAQRVNGEAAFFAEFITEVNTQNKSLAGVLRGCFVESLSDSTLVLQTAYTFHKEKLEEAKAMRILEQVAKDISGKNVKVEVELKQIKSSK